MELNAIKDKTSEIVEKLKGDPQLLESFQKEPEKTLESKLGVDIPDGMLDKIVEAVKKALAGGGDKLSGIKDSIKKLF